MTWVGSKSRNAAATASRSTIEPSITRQAGMGIRQRAAVTGGKIVDHQNVVAGGQEMLGQIGAEATGPAGDQRYACDQPRASFKCV